MNLPSRNDILQKKNIKRGFLPILLGLSVFFLPKYRRFIPLHILVFLICIILFWNFPIIITFSNSKPLYYEDLFLNTKELPNLEINEETKNAFKKAYTWILIITNSVLVACLSDYWLYKTENTTTFFEIVGVSGGILKIFQIINHYTGVVTLRIIKMNINNKISNMDYNSDNDAELL